MYSERNTYGNLEKEKYILLIENCSYGDQNLRNELYYAISRKYKLFVFFLKIEKEYKYQKKSINLKELNPSNFLHFLYLCWKSEIILTFTIRPLLIGFLIKLFCRRKKFFPTITGTGPLIESNKFIYKILRLIYPHILRRSNHTFFHNSEDAKYFTRNVIKNNFSVIGGSGINVKKIKSIEKSYLFKEKVPKIACFARLLKDKGILEYIEATEILFRNYPEFIGSVFLAGTFYKYNLKNNLITKATVSEWEKKGGIFLGQPKNKDLFYLDMDIICLPSYREGLSNVLLEAASKGCILVTTSVAGCEDIVKDEAGIICSPKSGIELYKAIYRAIKLSKKEQKTIKENALKRLKDHFSREKVISTYFKIITS